MYSRTIEVLVVILLVVVTLLAGLEFQSYMALRDIREALRGDAVAVRPVPHTPRSKRKPTEGRRPRAPRKAPADRPASSTDDAATEADGPSAGAAPAGEPSEQEKGDGGGGDAAADADAANQNTDASGDGTTSSQGKNGKNKEAAKSEGGSPAAKDGSPAPKDGSSPAKGGSPPPKGGADPPKARAAPRKGGSDADDGSNGRDSKSSPEEAAGKSDAGSTKKAVASGGGQSWEECAPAIRKFLKALLSGRYGEAADQYAPDAPARLPEAQLAKLLGPKVKRHGAFQKIKGHERIEKRSGSTGVEPGTRLFKVTVATERGKPLEFKIGLDPKNRVRYFW